MFFFLNVKGQTNSVKVENISTKDGLTKEELSYACNEYKKMIESDAYLENEKKVRAFAEKIQDFIISNNVPFDSIKNKTIALKLLKNNLKKTKFKSIEEAEKFIDEMDSSNKKMEEEHPRLFELLDKATLEQRHQIFQPFFKRVKSELGG
jgi:CRISPR/Cas system CSM-associated protein Csm2 small subunit